MWQVKSRVEWSGDFFDIHSCHSESACLSVVICKFAATEWVVCKSLLHEQWKLIDNLLIGMREPDVFRDWTVHQLDVNSGGGQSHVLRSLCHSLTSAVDLVRTRSQKWSSEAGTWLDSLTPSPGVFVCPYVCVYVFGVTNELGLGIGQPVIDIASSSVLRWRLVSHRLLTCQCLSRNVTGSMSTDREREETRSWNASELILDFTFD